VKPSLGCVVITGVSAPENNGSDVAPATVVRVWSDDLVNLKVHLDNHTDKWKTSVKLFDTEEEAREYGIAGACFWPPRV